MLTDIVDIPQFEENHAKWRAERRGELTKPDAFASLVAVEWPLKEGAHTVGKDTSNDIVLADAPSSPAHIGTLVVNGTAITFSPAEGLVPTATQGSKDVLTSVSMTDEDGRPKPIIIGDLTLMATPPRGGSPGLMVNDSRSSFLLKLINTPSLPAFPFAPSWIITATFTPVDSAEPAGPGVLSFCVPDGSAHTLQARGIQDNMAVTINFGDATNGSETYGGGRNLAGIAEKEVAENGSRKVLLDFNRAKNPICAYAPLAICPKPLDANKLKIRVEAGEKGLEEL